MSRILQKLGSGVSGAVLFGASNPPTTDCSVQVVTFDSLVNAQYVASPPAAGLDGRQTYIGKLRTLRLVFLADWSETDSFCEFLESAEGETVYLKFTPLASSTPRWLYTVQACPPGEGGTAGEFGLCDVTLPVLERTPTF